MTWTKVIFKHPCDLSEPDRNWTSTAMGSGSQWSCACGDVWTYHGTQYSFHRGRHTPLPTRIRLALARRNFLRVDAHAGFGDPPQPNQTT
jgi:hypothetical protein